MTSDYNADKGLWRAVLMQALADAHGAYKPGVSPERNKRIAETSFDEYKKNKAAWKEGEKPPRKPYRYFDPDLDTLKARAWFRGMGQDYRWVLNACEYDPGTFSRTMDTVITEIENLETYFKNKEGNR